MRALRERLFKTDDFLIGVELVSVRGTMATRNALKARNFARDLVEDPEIDWISITDNAGGNPQLAPHSLGKPILYAGKEVVIHLTCKDLNRNGLESEAWALHSEGFHNILAMTGDYPIAGLDGHAKAVFDIDSVGLIAMLDKMNRGLGSAAASRDETSRPDSDDERTDFLIGAVTTNFKLLEGELMPQYAKLERKVGAGARFIINQIGYDSRKISELQRYMLRLGLGHAPLIGNVYLLNPRVARLFHKGRIPGVVVTDALLELCERQAGSADRGQAFFEEFAAQQIAVYEGLGYRGAYIGGAHDQGTLRRILERKRRFAPDDWKLFAKRIQFSQPGEYFHYPLDPESLLADPDGDPATLEFSPPPPASLHYAFSKWSHDRFFSPGTAFAKAGARLCAKAPDPYQGPKSLRILEHLSKAALYRCKDCGDCSLPDIAFLCPESQCAKNQRNGPCGGTRQGKCEVDGYGDCIWLRAYERLKRDGAQSDLLPRAPVIQNQGLRRTSAWANNWLGRDHAKTPADVAQ